MVATANLPLAAELKANDLVVVDWPVDSVPEGVFPSENELVGRGLIDSVVKYKPILAAKLAPEGAGVGLPPVIPPGMRALPQPEGPEMETYSPFRMSRSILSSACVSTSSVKKNLGHGLEVNERLSSFVHDLSRSSSTELGRTRPTPRWYAVLGASSKGPGGRPTTLSRKYGVNGSDGSRLIKPTD